MDQINNIVLRRPDSIVDNKDFVDTIIHNVTIPNSCSDIDVKIHELIESILTSKKYINIFVPLSFGLSYSDFLGLRLALHIRTTVTPNQCSNIFIYGTETIEQIGIYNELYTTLFIKGIKLIDYSIESFTKFLSIKQIILEDKDLIPELSKLNLHCPDNFYDNHSVSNIWGMFRILELDGIDPKNIKTLHTEQEKMSSIYFKWLLAKNKNPEVRNEEVKEVQRNYSVVLPGLKVIGKINLPLDKKRK